MAGSKKTRRTVSLRRRNTSIISLATGQNTIGIKILLPILQTCWLTHTRLNLCTCRLQTLFLLKPGLQAFQILINQTGIQRTPTEEWIRLQHFKTQQELSRLSGTSYRLTRPKQKRTWANVRCYLKCYIQHICQEQTTLVQYLGLHYLK